VHVCCVFVCVCALACVCECVCMCEYECTYVCVRVSSTCVDNLADLQHAQHGAQSGLHSRNGRVARTLSYLFDPQECVCGGSL
jgi:hypothetical protein